ncbi:MAG: single-stranded DNA-binding protein [Cytophagales bacterium]|nr:single-stranded DNA-binding protein [Cytophagales bacterium]
MAGVNKVILIGNLGSDPEIRHLSNGSVVANFNIATSETYNNKNGERVTQTEWHRIELWDGLAKVAEQYLKKGQTVYIEGKLKTENWQDSDGNNRTTTRIRGLNMTMLGGRSGTDQQAGGEYQKSQQQPVTPAPQSPVANTPAAADDEIDDLPF